MPQINQGIRAVLQTPFVYSLFGWLTGGKRGRTILVRDYIRPQSGDHILDIGCGPADLLPFLPDINYIGFDISPDYINAARKRFGDRATFICEPVTTATLPKQEYFDLVLAIGILHHLNDAEAIQLFHLAHTALRPGGRLITFDGVYVTGQSPIARWIISKDRGQNVRTTEGYLQLAQPVFDRISVNINHKLLRIPYTHLILECTK